MSENLRVFAWIFFFTAVAVAVLHLTSEGRVTAKIVGHLSLVDHDCEDAQQQYYVARNRAQVGENQHPAAQDDAVSKERNHADVCAQKRMADAAEAGFWLLLFSLVAASAAAVAGWVTVRVMRDTARREMRAYVGICSAAVQLVNLKSGGLGITVSFDFKNEGQTPANDFTTWLKPPIIATPEAIPFGSPTPISERSGASILSPHTMAHTQFTFAVSEAELADLQSGAKRIFAWGGLDYTDAFGEVRYYRFRCVDNKATNLRPGQAVGLSPHKLGYEGN